MLVTKRALGPLLDDLRAAADAAARARRAHRDTPIIGRTLLQQAQPTTFGLKAAGWMLSLDDAADHLDERAGWPSSSAARSGTLDAAAPRSSRASSGLDRAACFPGTRCAPGSASSPARSASPRA